MGRSSGMQATTELLLYKLWGENWPCHVHFGLGACVILALEQKNYLPSSMTRASNKASLVDATITQQT